MIELVKGFDRMLEMAQKLGLPPTIDFRSCRMMHASLMQGYPARLEVARDSMRHSGNTGSIMVDVYSKAWWDERVDAVTRVVEAVFAEPERKKEKFAYSVEGPPRRRSGR